MYTFRPYQAEAISETIAYFGRTKQPGVIVAATGAGKSLIIAGISKHYGSALVLHPSRELVAQNAAKYAAYGLDDHSIFCAGLGSKSAAGNVIFASHQSLAVDEIPEIKILIIDEVHKFLEATARVVKTLRARFPDLLVLGLTATPYLIGRGFIYQQTVDGRTLTDEEARAPFFLRCIYEITPEELIAQGFLMPLVMGDVDDRYNGQALEVNKSGWFTADSVEKTTTCDKNRTARIARQILQVMQQRIAVMVFCSSVDHANDFLRHMPPGRAKLITGETKTKDRDRILKAYRAGMFDILVNVATLTTGVDLPLVDTIAILRFTESAALWEQIVGRGMRLSPETRKTECLVMDFTENVETFFPSGNVYQPEIRAVKEKISETMMVPCPTCEYSNKFALARNEMGLPVSVDGYFMDLSGHYVLDDDGQKVIAHYGRRCQFIDQHGERCNHRFAAKKCPSCKTDNDIAARKCIACGKALVDWNRHLKNLAQRLPVVESKVGDWTIGRVDAVHTEQMKPGQQKQAVFSVAKRKKPIRKWLGGNKEIAIAIDHGHIPHAVAWRKAFRGGVDVRVLWSPLELENFIGAHK